MTSNLLWGVLMSTCILALFHAPLSLAEASSKSGAEVCKGSNDDDGTCGTCVDVTQRDKDPLQMDSSGCVADPHTTTSFRVTCHNSGDGDFVEMALVNTFNSANCDTSTFIRSLAAKTGSCANVPTPWGNTDTLEETTIVFSCPSGVKTTVGPSLVNRDSPEPYSVTVQPSCSEDSAPTGRFPSLTTSSDGSFALGSCVTFVEANPKASFSTKVDCSDPTNIKLVRYNTAACFGDVQKEVALSDGICSNGYIVRCQPPTPRPTASPPAPPPPTPPPQTPSPPSTDEATDDALPASRSDNIAVIIASVVVLVVLVCLYVCWLRGYKGPAGKADYEDIQAALAADDKKNKKRSRRNSSRRNSLSPLQMPMLIAVGSDTTLSNNNSIVSNASTVRSYNPLSSRSNSLTDLSSDIDPPPATTTVSVGHQPPQQQQPSSAPLAQHQAGQQEPQQREVEL